MAWLLESRFLLTGGINELVTRYSGREPLLCLIEHFIFCYVYSVLFFKRSAAAIYFFLKRTEQFEFLCIVVMRE